MNIQNIMAFLAIVQTGSITKAARDLYATQSTVSHRLKSLEEEMKATLIVRHKGHQTVSLTDKGKNFIPIAERWLSLWKDVHAMQREEARVQLTIASVDSLNIYMFPAVYKQLLACVRQPVDLRIRTHQSVEIYRLLENQEIDAGFVLRPILCKNIEIVPVLKEPMVLIQRRFGKAEEAYPVHPRDLDPAYEFYIDWSPSFASWHDHWWSDVCSPHLHVDTAGLILQLMDDPHHWAIVSLSMARAFQQSKDFVIRPIEEAPPERVIYKLTHKYPKPSTVQALESLDICLHDFISSWQTAWVKTGNEVR